MTKPGPEAILRAWRAAEHESPAATGASPARGRALAATAVLGAVAAALLLQSPDSDGNLLRAGRAGGLMGDQRGSHMQSVTTIIGAATVAIPLALSANASAQQGAAVQWRVEDGGNGHWYQFVPNTTCTWDEGRLAAQSAGGHLATLTAEEENEFANGIVSASDIGWIGGLYGPFIGGSRHGQPSWTWLTTETFAFQPWGPGEPNNDSGGCAQEEYLTMLNHPSAPATWNDVTNSARAGSQCTLRTSSGFMVEWSADCNNDGIVDYGQCRDGSLADLDGDNVPDCCERGEPCVPGFFPKRWRIEDGGNGHWYQLRITGPMTWSNARALAGSIGGHLATPTSGNENQFIVPLANHPKAWVADCCGNTGGPWLGGYQPLDADPSAPWEWVTGEPWSWTGWAAGEPNNGIDRGQLVTGLLGYPPLGDNYRGWCDAFGNGSSPNHPGSYPLNVSHIVEWSADCNNDGIVDYGQILQGQLADADANGIPDLCEVPTCADADLNPNGAVDGADLGALLAFWGPVSPAFPRADINGDGTVNGADLGILLSVWGPCGG